MAQFHGWARSTSSRACGYSAAQRAALLVFSSRLAMDESPSISSAAEQIETAVATAHPFMEKGGHEAPHQLALPEGSPRNQS
jgi:hypothetical protein